jgi:protein-tyrosine phosphatase
MHVADWPSHLAQMGVAVSGVSDSQHSLNAVMLLAVDGSKLTPISMLDFISSPSSYSGRCLIIVEPTNLISEQNSCARPILKALDFHRTMDTIRSHFNFRPFRDRGCNLWISVPAEVDHGSFMRSIQNMRFLQFHCSEVLSLNDIFAAVCSTKSVQDAFRRLPKVTAAEQLTVCSTSAGARCTACVIRDYDQITPNVYVGNSTVLTKSVLHSLGITHVVSISSIVTKSALISGVQHLQVQLNDCPFAEFTTEFWEAVEFVGKAVRNGGIVMLHCQMGISRSPALCVAYLIEKLGHTYDTALELVKRQRPSVLLNPGFVQQLKQYAKQHQTVAE